ncbi:MAG: RusA family crossover junction endodeoxyribonuclease [Bacteroidetes bacterium]|nr:RusA family crossover junction endodeoxyribonuclease [Bacteroidota bacterium]
MKVTVNKDPDLDFFIGYFGGDKIPTKQDWFDRMEGYELIQVEDGVETKLDDYDLYIKQKDKDVVQIFKKHLHDLVTKYLKPEHPYKKPEPLEVIIDVSMDEKRLQEVDIDNLTKAILDSLNGLVYEDDSQIISLLATKNVNGFIPINGLLIGVRRLTNKQSWFDHIRLAYIKEEQ